MVMSVEEGQENGKGKVGRKKLLWLLEKNTYIGEREVWSKAGVCNLFTKLKGQYSRIACNGGPHIGVFRMQQK